MNVGSATPSRPLPTPPRSGTRRRSRRSRRCPCRGRRRSSGRRRPGAARGRRGAAVRRRARCRARRRRPRPRARCRSRSPCRASVPVTNTSSTGMIAARRAPAAASASTRTRSSRWRRRWLRPARRRPGEAGAAASGSRALRSAAASANEAASSARAAGTPSTAMVHRASDDRPGGDRDRERDAEQRVALAQEPVRLRHGDDGALDERPPGDGEDAVGECQGEDQGDGRSARGGHGERPEQRRLGDVHAGQQPRRAGALERGDGERREQARGRSALAPTAR